ncbi:hypothetical protein M9H77_23768 [Catharanthus roseus]|uniref:Uncharacterized protein n=1 Tax=Catharanthus roseus TaxID=4058 RepID=A0ACC0AVY6_CATRO|nr:hypothetical protein M9H77_23768 [Catharanthus roseus]
MDKYFEKWKKGSKPVEETLSKKPRVGVEFSDCEIIGDPGLRKPIDSYPYEVRDELRRRVHKDVALCFCCYSFAKGQNNRYAHIGFRLLIVLIGYLKILIKILSFDRGIYPRKESKNYKNVHNE